MFSVTSDELTPVCVNERQTGASTPMSEQSRLDIVMRDIVLVQSVRLKEDLSGSHVVCCSLKGEEALDVMILFDGIRVHVELYGVRTQGTVRLERTRLGRGLVLIVRHDEGWRGKDSSKAMRQDFASGWS